MAFLNRDKGPRPTPKNLEWGTVEKMWLTSHSLAPHDIPAEFRDADNKLREMQVILDVLTKRAKIHVKSIIGSTQACAALGAHMSAVATALGDLQLVAKSLNAYADALLAGINGHADLRSKIEAKYCPSLETFLNEHVNPSRESKRIWEGTKKEANAGYKKLEETYNSTVDAQDPLKVFITQYNVQLLHQKEVIKFEETADMLCDSAWMRDFRFLYIQCLFMMEHYESLLTRYAPCHKVKEFETEFDDALAKAKIEAQRRTKETEETWSKYLHDLHESRYDNLVELLSQPDLALLNSFLIVCAAEQEQVLVWIIKTMDAYKKVMPIIEQGITNEVENTKEAATLFRGNSTATKLMTHTTKLVGQHYLVIIKPLLEEIQRAHISYEVDPTKAKPGENIAQNMQNLTSMCQRMLDTILNSLDKCPLPFREMAHRIHQDVGKRFPGQAKRMAVGGFVFLRFFCPAVSAPDSTKIIEVNFSPDARRGLILIGKVLQNLANGMKFGQKEAYMIEMNGFIEKNLARVEAFLDQIATLPEAPAKFHLCTLAEAKSTILPELHKKLVQYMEVIIKSLKSYKHNVLIFPFIQILSELGDVDVAIIPAPKSADPSKLKNKPPKLGK